jgi:hypothetical protein
MVFSQALTRTLKLTGELWLPVLVVAGIALTAARTAEHQITNHPAVAVGLHSHDGGRTYHVH